MLSALRKTLMLFWILTLGMVAALKYLIFDEAYLCHQAECNRCTRAVGILTNFRPVHTASGQEGCTG